MAEDVQKTEMDNLFEHNKTVGDLEVEEGGLEEKKEYNEEDVSHFKSKSLRKSDLTDYQLACC